MPFEARPRNENGIFAKMDRLLFQINGLIEKCEKQSVELKDAIDSLKESKGYSDYKESKGYKDYLEKKNKSKMVDQGNEQYKHDQITIMEDIKIIKDEIQESKTISEDLREMLNYLLKMIQNFFKNTDNIHREEEKVEHSRLGFF